MSRQKWACACPLPSLTANSIYFLFVLFAAINNFSLVHVLYFVNTLKDPNFSAVKWNKYLYLLAILEVGYQFMWKNYIFGYISYAIKKVRNSLLLIFEKNGLVWPADIWPAHFFQILKVRKI